MKKLNLILPLMFILGVILGCSATKKEPEWQKAQVLAEKVDHPQAITTDDQFIYYVTGGTIASLNEGTSGVWKMPLAGGQPVQLFKGCQIDKDHVLLPDTFVLATDEKYVYWSSGAIWRTPKTGGESEKITTGMPTEWALDDARIYWHNFGGENSPPTPIYVVDKKGGEAKAFTEPVITTGIVLDTDFLYWAQSDGIYKLAKSGGGKIKVFSPPEKQSVSGLSADKDNFYFTLGDGRNALMKLNKLGGEPQKIAPEINHIYKFYTDGKFIYFIKNEGSFETTLNKVSVNGGEITRLDNGYLASFTVGTDKVFITDIARIYSLAK
ncbi:MAG TPA: DUF5050 domain-containing protein [Pyrinomonadaceae bacterium]|nr:DUF5050 domain-containing protein [Pyrinomonadaceae bacterium]